MKVLFLDIDGVLNSRRYFEFSRKNRPSYPLGHLDPQAMALLNGIVSTVNCQIVISSTWRRHMEIEEVRKLFRYCHFEYWWNIINYTPYIYDADRGVEISAWLATHANVTRYAIVDDDADMANLGEWLVQTNYDDGLTMQDAEKIIKLLI